MAIEKIRLNGFAGRRVSVSRVTEVGGERGTLLLVLTPDRIHHLGVFIRSEIDEGDAATRRIIDSFQLIPSTGLGS
jgi:hypothetical protein